jgi:hypothetical protein
MRQRSFGLFYGRVELQPFVWHRWLGYSLQDQSSIMTHNPIDVVGPSAQRSTHFGLIPSKVVNASDPRAMAANVVENRFDDVGQHPQPISHHRGGGAPKIMQPPIRQGLGLHAGICHLLTCREYARIKRSLRLRPTREAAMAIALPARAISEDMFPALEARREQCYRGIGEGKGVFSMIFGPGAGNGPNGLFEGKFDPTHAADFVPPLGSQHEQLYNPSVIITAKACPNLSKFALREDPLA